MRRLVLAIAGLAFLGGAFAFGLWVGTYQPPFYHQLRALKRSLSGADNGPPKSGEAQMLESAFTDTMIAGQVLPPVRTIDEASERVRAYEVDVAAFATAYDQLTISSASQDGDRLAVRYDLAGRSYTAYAYAPATPAGHRCAAVIVPGSGPNQASEIFAGSPTNYHGAIVPAIRDLCEPFVFVKPNEDFLAIHNGARKLSYTAIAVYLLNRGYSYSAHYIISALAIVKHVRTTYPIVVPMGLSQGGDAALNVALQSAPAGAVIASGFSVLDAKLAWANLEQVIIPGAYRNFNERVHQTVASAPTRYFFTSGTNEGVTWAVEAETQSTCKFFTGLANVSCLIHKGGHEFPLPEVRSFLQSLIAQP